jgi:hypothetical protein
VDGVSMSSNNTPTPSIYLDSGASEYLFPDRLSFRNYSELSSPFPIYLGDNSVIYAVGRGDYLLQLPNNRSLLLKDAFYVPELAKGLVSVAQLMHDNMALLFYQGKCQIIDLHDHKIVAVIAEDCGMFPVIASPMTRNMHANAAISLRRLHDRLGHPNNQALAKLCSNDLVLGLKLLPYKRGDGPYQLPTCEPCQLGGHKRSPVTKDMVGTPKAFPNALHGFDICEFPICTVGGHKYMVVFYDSFSKYPWVYFLKNKSDLLQTFKKHRAAAEVLSSTDRIRAVRCDNAGEQTSVEFKKYLEDNTIHQELTVPYHSSQNGGAERLIGVLCAGGRTFLAQSPWMDIGFYGHAIQYYADCRRVVPSAAIDFLTPHQKFFGTKPSIAQYRTWGCKAWIHLEKHETSKIENQAIPVYFLGFAANHKAWEFYDPETNSILVSCDATWDEDGTTLSSDVSSSTHSPTELNSFIPPDLHAEIRELQVTDDSANLQVSNLQVANSQDLQVTDDSANLQDSNLQVTNSQDLQAHNSQDLPVPPANLQVSADSSAIQDSNVRTSTRQRRPVVPFWDAQAQEQQFAERHGLTKALRVANAVPAHFYRSKTPIEHARSGPLPAISGYLAVSDTDYERDPQDIAAVAPMIPLSVPYSPFIREPRSRDRTKKL